MAWVGTITAIFAATIGLAQTDIKRVLAYSTISQLGYMFAAVGLGAYVAGAFHLVTHAFFKALLFLGAGSVIHGLNGEQDLRKMGGLAYKMPITATTMWIGGLGLAGAPPLAGFFSKDEILAAALDGSATRRSSSCWCSAPSSPPSTPSACSSWPSAARRGCPRTCCTTPTNRPGS